MSGRRLADDGLRPPRSRSCSTASSRSTPLRRLASFRTLHVSTGRAPAFATPAGPLQRSSARRRNSWSVPYRVWLPWASYFVGGVAFHELPDVPGGPRPHTAACASPRYDAQWLYSFAPLGTPVRVLATS